MTPAESGEDRKHADQVPDVAPGRVEAKHPAQYDADRQYRCACDGEIEWDILGRLVELVDRVGNVDVAGKNAEVRRGEHLHP